jgi:outer membrane protein assembly factor BamB
VQISRLLLAPLLLLCISAAGAEDWPRWRGPRGDGTWNGPKLRTEWQETDLPQRWRQPIGGGYAGVVVAGDRVVTMDRQTAPAEVERILCYAADSGEPLWTYEYPVAYGELTYGNGPRAAPTIDGDHVFTFGALGHFACVELVTGREVWRKDLAAELGAVKPEWGFAASPVIFEEVVIVHPGCQPGGCFVAFDRQTGVERWRSGDDPAGYCTPILIEHSGQPLLVGWTPKHVVGIDPRDGRQLWRIPYEVTYGVSIATPIAHDGMIFVAGYWEGSKAIRLGATAETAELAWEDDKQLRGLMSQPLFRDGHAFLLDKIFGVTCFELATGKVLWDDDNRLTPRGRNPQASLVWTGHDDQILALNAEGELILGRLHPQGYTELARRKILGTTWAHPAYAGSRVYARSDEELVCVELPVEQP